MSITAEQLKKEYDNWGVRNRNHIGQRFGQHIYNKYDYEYGKSYWMEGKRDAYVLLLEGLSHDPR